MLKLWLAAGCIAVSSLQAQNTPISQMELLGRGVVALPSNSGKGNFLSWRMLGTDSQFTTFDVLRNGVAIQTDVCQTNFLDLSGDSESAYQIRTKVNGKVVDISTTVYPWQDVYKSVTLNRPAGNGSYGYSPNDMSVGDADGDGEYELFVKWDPSNSKDNSSNGTTGIVYIDCYKLDGTMLWRIDLGRNIRAGAHYTQFMVYDFDGDGKAEMICKTAPGSVDGQGNYVNSAATDNAIKSADNTKSWLNSNGRVNGGQEYLTVFEGLTGKAVHTIAYYPNRNALAELSEKEGTFNWATGRTDNGSYGNRGERYLAAVACLDGADKPASAVFCRGYYTYAHLFAVSFNGRQLCPRWLHSSTSSSTYQVTTWDKSGTATTKTYNGSQPTSGSGTMYGNGNHNLSVADVDGDGSDEIIWGAAACNNDGTLLYATGFGHGDAIHVGKHSPDRPGYQVFQIHEEGGAYSWDLHDAATGEVLLKGGNSGVDNGRGIAGQFDANVRGSLFWSADDKVVRSAVSGEVVSQNTGSYNFRIYWDGDLQEELLDGGKLEKWTGNGVSRLYVNSKNPYDYNYSNSCNSTKATPNLQADLFGDWREEFILWSGADSATINIFTTNMETKYRIPTLMHDHVYRMGVAWQNVGYNQPPHLGYYLPDYKEEQLIQDEDTLQMTMIAEYSFDDMTHPSLTAGNRVTFDYSHTSVVTNTPFLNIWGANNTNGATDISLCGSDLTDKDWKLSFYWAGYAGCNERTGETILKAGDTQLFSIIDEANWSTTFSLIYGDGGIKSLPVSPCDKNTRLSNSTGDAYNTADYWYHFTITGNAEGVWMTVERNGMTVVPQVMIHESNIIPTLLSMKPGSCGAVGIDELTFGCSEENLLVPEMEDNMLYIADGLRFSKSKTNTLPISMKNEDEIVGFQFDVVLPEGLTLALNNKGKYDVTKTDRAAGHSLSSNVLADGTIRIVGTSMDNDIIEGFEGVLVNMGIGVAEWVADGDYAIQLKNVKMTNEDKQTLTCADKSFVVKVGGKMGDVNHDDAIDVTDAVLIIDEILVKHPDNFDATLADVNRDGSIDVTDVVMVIDAILGKMQLSRAATRAEKDLTAYTAFQMDLTIPAGYVLEGVELTEIVKMSHSLAYNMLADGRCRIVVFSMDNEALPGAWDEVIRLNLRGQGDAFVNVDRAMFVTVGGERHELLLNGTTSIAQLSTLNSQFSIVYDLQGRKVEKTVKGVYVIDGKKVVIK